MINKKFVLKQEVSNKKCLDTRETPEIRDTLVPTEKWKCQKKCETSGVKQEMSKHERDTRDT